MSEVRVKEEKKSGKAGGNSNPYIPFFLFVMNVRKERRRVFKGRGGEEKMIEKGGYAERKERREREREKGMHVLLCHIVNELSKASIGVIVYDLSSDNVLRT